MSEEKDLVVRLADLVKELPASFAPAVLEAGGEIERLRGAVRDQDKAFRGLMKERDGVAKEAEALTEENESLRISLHHRELEVARLEGYRERVNEFDPVTEQREYEDQLPAAARPRHHDGAGIAVAANHRTSHWFQRGRRA